MAGNEEKLKKDFDHREKMADNIIWKRLKDRAKELGYGSFEVKFVIHGGQIRNAEIYNKREKVAVV